MTDFFVGLWINSAVEKLIDNNEIIILIKINSIKHN